MKEYRLLHELTQLATVTTDMPEKQLNMLAKQAYREYKSATGFIPTFPEYLLTCFQKSSSCLRYSFMVYKPVEYIEIQLAD